MVCRCIHTRKSFVQSLVLTYSVFIAVSVCWDGSSMLWQWSGALVLSGCFFVVGFFRDPPPDSIHACTNTLSAPGTGPGECVPQWRISLELLLSLCKKWRRSIFYLNRTNHQQSSAIVSCSIMCKLMCTLNLNDVHLV